MIPVEAWTSYKRPIVLVIIVAIIICVIYAVWKKFFKGVKKV